MSDYIPCGVMDSDDSYSRFECPFDARTCSRHPWRNKPPQSFEEDEYVCQCVYPDKCFCSPKMKQRRADNEQPVTLAETGMFDPKLVAVVAQVIHDTEHHYDEPSGTPCDMCEGTAHDILVALVKADYVVEKVS